MALTMGVSVVGWNKAVRVDAPITTKGYAAIACHGVKADASIMWLNRHIPHLEWMASAPHILHFDYIRNRLADAPNLKGETLPFKLIQFCACQSLRIFQCDRDHTPQIVISGSGG